MHPAVRLLLQYANHGYAQPLTLTRLARLVHMDAKYLGRLFRQQMGLSFHAYLNARRLRQAAALLPMRWQRLARQLPDHQKARAEELRLRAGGSGGLSIQLMTLPAVTCCTRRCEGHTIAEKYNAMYDFYGQCVRQGCRLSHEPIFTISERTDYLEGRVGDTPYPFHVCVPVRPENAPEEAVTLPECRALSVLYYGDYSGVDEAFLALGREVRERRLKPAGFVRVLGIVAPYSGREIETQRYCSRIVLPVEE